jgi:hypothetical protein
MGSTNQMALEVPMSRDDLVQESALTLRSLGDVLTWLQTFNPRGEILGVVGLDEFTNDVITRVQPDVYAVFDTT